MNAAERAEDCPPTVVAALPTSLGVAVRIAATVVRGFDRGAVLGIAGRAARFVG